jgi:hypothetical protein
MWNSPSKILMVRPAAFGYNAETAANNSFQSQAAFSPDLVLQQFDSAVNALREEGIEVLVIDDLLQPPKPDAIFPNNWFSVVQGQFQLYPMFAANRRLERRADVKEKIEAFTGRKMELVDWSLYENEGRFLEGTGSLVLDRLYERVYASLSPRTDESLVRQWAAHYDYEAIIFHAYDGKQQAIYHSNVVLGLGEAWAVLCLECVAPEEHEMLRTSLQECGKELIEITREQMNAFAGNCMELSNGKGEKVMVMSTTGWNSLHDNQKEKIHSLSTPLLINVSEIERIGGGSIRCMIAELE